MLGGRAAYRRFVLAGIDTSHEARYYPGEGQPFLGAPGFADRGRPPACPAAGAVPGKPLDVALSELAGRLAVDPDTLRGPDRSQSVSRARAAVSLVLVRRLATAWPTSGPRSGGTRRRSLRSCGAWRAVSTRTTAPPRPTSLSSARISRSQGLTPDGSTTLHYQIAFSRYHETTRVVADTCAPARGLRS